MLGHLASSGKATWHQPCKGSRIFLVSLIGFRCPRITLKRQTGLLGGGWSSSQTCHFLLGISSPVCPHVQH